MVDEEIAALRSQLSALETLVRSREVQPSDRLWTNVVATTNNIDNQHYLRLERKLAALTNTSNKDIEKTIEELSQTLAAQQLIIAELQTRLQGFATKEYVRTYVDLMSASQEYKLFTVESSFMGYEVLLVEKLIPLFITGRSLKTTDQWNAIFTEYDDHSRITDVNPYLLVAQMALETNWGRSWWSMPPRNNPANLGVTGEVKPTSPDKNLWAYDDVYNVYRRGMSFANWSFAIQAHIGYILAYCLRDEDATPVQKLYIQKAPLPQQRGTSVKVKDLSDTEYTQKIINIANKLKQ